MFWALQRGPLINSLLRPQSSSWSRTLLDSCGCATRLKLLHCARGYRLLRHFDRTDMNKSHALIRYRHILLVLAAFLFVFSGVVPTHSDVLMYSLFGCSLLIAALAAALSAKGGASFARTVAISALAGGLTTGIPLAIIGILHVIGTAGYFFVIHPEPQLPMWAVVALAIAIPAALFAAVGTAGYTTANRRESKATSS
jgi:hypothetical protein